MPPSPDANWLLPSFPSVHSLEDSIGLNEQVMSGFEDALATLEKALSDFDAALSDLGMSSGNRKTKRQLGSSK